MSDGSIESFETPSSTPNFQTELAAKLSQLMPEAIADGKIDLEKVKELLGDDLLDDRERFGLFWPGKKRALRAAQDPTTATLKPDHVNSKNWDETKNIFIEGDNLEVLKILQKHYHGKIKMIYIDPPYNTGKDFIYPDNFQEGIKSYLEYSNQLNESGQRMSTNAETSGRYHSNWLNMIYPRLKLARNLLTEDGAIFMSIDDAEFDNLRKVGNEIFGEDNFIGTMVWAAGRKNDSRYISTSHEYILCFARNVNFLSENGIKWKTRKKGLDSIYKKVEKLLIDHKGNFEEASRDLRTWYKNLPDTDEAKQHSHYSRIDSNGVFFPGDISWPGGGGPKYEVLHPVTNKPVKTPASGWRFPQQEKMKEQIDSGRVYFGSDETTVPTLKRYLKETESEAPYSVFYQDGRSATRRLRTLMEANVFDFPKDETVIQTLIEMVTEGDDIVADFFAGSGTTAHAVFLANQTDGGTRRWLQVQLPEPIPQDSPAFDAGFRKISEVTRARIEKSGEQIDSMNANQLPGEAGADLGFRSYSLVETNFSKWDFKSDITPENLQREITGLDDNSEDTASPNELVTEILLKQGYSLSEAIGTLKIDDLQIQTVGENLVFAYLDEKIKPKLSQLRSVLDRNPARFIFLEDAFQGDDELKTNLFQECKSRRIELRTI